MPLSRLNRSVTSWIAIFAILMAALAPAISQAAYRASGDPMWLEICTAYGIERGSPDPAPDPAGDSAQRLAKPCVYCSLFASTLPPLSQPMTVPSVRSGTDVIGEFVVLVPRPRLAWAASRARAPPVRT